MSLAGKTILITGAARRIGRSMALAVAQAGGDVIIHHGHSPEQAEEVKEQAEAFSVRSHIIQADLGKAAEIEHLISEALEFGPLFGLINNASIFDPLNWKQTTLDDWDRHMRVNLSAPFLLSQRFAEAINPEAQGRIINILDWRALRPGADHLPYTISKAGLAALTRSLAIALAPNITVNGLAFGAILPPSDGGLTQDLLEFVPAKRWADLKEVDQALLFLLTGPSYINGEIIHLDGGRHLV
ncbi:MAG: SDR family oxidoreductase [Anaerolineales bacterium]|nr:SDR family oxidoreductase [Chloroflexota bacterium]MBL6983856.1 SDR family oxidoreductase [Anaerolineales bacterium]